MVWLAQRDIKTKYQSNRRLSFPISISQNEIVIIWRHFAVRTSITSLVFRSVDPRAIFVLDKRWQKTFSLYFEFFFLNFSRSVPVQTCGGQRLVNERFVECAAVWAPCAYICHRIKRNKCKYGKHTYWLCVYVFDVMMVFRIYDGTLDSVSHTFIHSCRHGLWPMHLFCNSIFMFFPQNVRVNRWNARHKGHILISYFRIRCDFFAIFLSSSIDCIVSIHIFKRAHFMFGFSFIYF